MAVQPNVWIWGGDIIYGDSHNLDTLQSKYTLQKSRKDYQEMINTCSITGTWDDHDYGVNDGGKFFSKKNESKVLMLNFLDIPPSDPVWNHNGVYHLRTYGAGKNQVKIFNLDTRSFRDTVYREFYFDSTLNRKRYRYNSNETGDILGEAQWLWLEEELRNSGARLNIINSSIQVIASAHDFEKWANFPASHKRLLELLRKYPTKKVIILSGDRHIAEISAMDIPDLPYTLYDITSSGLTHTWSEVWEEPNVYRLGELIINKNFGLLEFQWNKKSFEIRVSIRGKNNEVFLERVISFK